MEKAGCLDHKNSTGAALSDLVLERNPMQIAKWGFFNFGLIYASCQANFGNARADVWFRTPEHVSPVKCRKSWPKVWTPTQSWHATKRKRHLLNFLSKSENSLRYEWTIERPRAWATDLGLGHPFGGHSTIPRLSVLIQPKCPQRSIWFVFVSHYSCSMSRCTRSFHLFRSLAQSSPEVLKYLEGSSVFIPFSCIIFHFFFFNRLWCNHSVFTCCLFSSPIQRCGDVPPGLQKDPGVEQRLASVRHHGHQ